VTRLWQRGYLPTGPVPAVAGLSGGAQMGSVLPLARLFS